LNEEEEYNFANASLARERARRLVEQRAREEQRYNDQHENNWSSLRESSRPLGTATAAWNEREDIPGPLSSTIIDDTRNNSYEAHSLRPNDAHQMFLNTIHLMAVGGTPPIIRVNPLGDSAMARSQIPSNLAMGSANIDPNAMGRLPRALYNKPRTWTD